MIVGAWNRLVEFHIKTEWIKPVTAAIGALLLYAGFQPLPPKYAAAAPILSITGILLEVFLTYVFATGTKRDRKTIKRHKTDIENAVDTIRDLQGKTNTTGEKVFEIEGDIRDAESRVQGLAEDAKSARQDAETALRKAEKVKKDIVRGLDNRR